MIQIGIVIGKYHTYLVTRLRLIIDQKDRKGQAVNLQSLFLKRLLHRFYLRATAYAT